MDRPAGTYEIRAFRIAHVRVAENPRNTWYVRRTGFSSASFEGCQSRHKLQTPRTLAQGTRRRRRWCTSAPATNYVLVPACEMVLPPRYHPSHNIEHEHRAPHQRPGAGTGRWEDLSHITSLSGSVVQPVGLSYSRRTKDDR